MQKVRLVKKVLGDMFAKHGYEYAGRIGGGVLEYVWEFKKTPENGNDQIITIILDRYTYIRMYSVCFYIRSKYGQCGVKEIVPESEQAEQREFLSYWEVKDDDEFVKALEEIGDIIEKYGFAKLDELSVSPYKFEPTYEMFVKLFKGHKELSAKFMKEHNISDDITLGESIEVIKGIVEAEGERVYDDETKDRLIELAAFYGEQLIKKYEGNWDWCKVGKDRCAVFNMKNLIGSAYVLHRILITWEKANAENITELYESMVRKEKYVYVDGKTWDYKGP